MIARCFRTYEEIRRGQAVVCQKAFVASTAIRIHFPENVWWSRIRNSLYVVQNPPAKPLTQDGDG
ncbi:MAG: hypothetical protein ACLT1J_03660 [Mediterraneibacter gnavus]